MKFFKIQVAQTWIEYGEVTIEADSEEDARAWVNDHIHESEEFEWSAGDPQETTVESITEEN